MSSSPRLEPPDVSACVITYNHAQYLTECLDGILAQEGDFTMEVVVADDCSIDGTREIAEAFARRDPRIRLLDSKRNVGMGSNVQRAFAACTGAFVAVCEGDDFWIDRQKLSRQLAVMKARPDVSLCITAGRKVSEDGARRLADMQIAKANRELGLTELIRAVSGRVPTASLTMRRTALEALTAEIYRHAPIDYSLQVLLGLQGKVWYDAAETAAYRANAQGSWSEGLALSAETFLAHHQTLRTYGQFLEAQLPPRYTDDVRRAFEPVIVGFYLSSRITPADKARNLALDLPRLSRRGRIAATVLTRAPILVRAGAFARRRIWGPYLKPFLGS